MINRLGCFHALTKLLLPTYEQMLGTLFGLLEKAEAEMPGQSEAILSARLAPDMLPLAAQVRFPAFQVREAIHRLRGEPLPPELMAIAIAGHNSVAEPGTMEEARACITGALRIASATPERALDGGASLPIVIELPGGLTFHMTGAEYARDWALPQFYFHIDTAYAIVRHFGIDIGKANYLPHMIAYQRDGA